MKRIMSGIVLSLLFVLMAATVSKQNAYADTTVLTSLELPAHIPVAGESAITTNKSGSGDGYRWEGHWEPYGKQGTTFSGTFEKGNDYTYLYMVYAESGYDITQVPESNIVIGDGTAGTKGIYWYQAAYSRWLIRQNYHIQGDSYTMKFEANGGSGTMAAVSVEEGNRQLPACAFIAPSGYEFKSWSIDGNSYMPGSSYEVKGDVTLKAEWLEIATYSVSFNLLGHGDSISPVTGINYNNTISKPTDPKAEDYIFVAWYKEEACTNLWNFSSDKVTNDTILYAKWIGKVKSAEVSAGIPIAGENATVKTGEETEYTWEARWEPLNRQGVTFYDKFEEGTTYTILFIVAAKSGYSVAELSEDSITKPNWTPNGSLYYQSNYNRVLLRMNFTVRYEVEDLSFEGFTVPRYNESTHFTGVLNSKAPTTGAALSLDTVTWEKKNSDGNWDSYTKDTFDDGTYRASVAVIYESDSYKLNKATKITVDGDNWGSIDNDNFSYDGTKSTGLVVSKEYTVLHTHTYKDDITPATLSADGKVESKCTICGDVKDTSIIKKIVEVKLADSTIKYNASRQQPSVIAKDSAGNALVATTDYTVTYSEGCTVVGTYTANVTFKGNYSGNKTLNFEIVPCDSLDARLAKEKYTYDGKTKTPKVIINDVTGNALVLNRDYTAVLDSGRKNIGKYSVKITYKGNYSGSTKLSFEIVPKGTNLGKLSAQKGAVLVTWKKQEKMTSGYQLQYSLSSKFESAKTVNISKNTTLTKTISKLAKGKKYYVRIRTYKTVKGKKYFSDWSKSKSIKTLK